MRHPLALFAALRGRLRALFRRGDVERDLDDEIRFHLEMETEKNIREGMTPDDARRAALVAFGGVARITEEHRFARGTRLIEDAVADLRYAVRTLARTPGFVAVSVFTLAIAIAIGTSLFTAVNGFFYRPLPVPGGAGLVSIFTSSFRGGDGLGGSSHRDLVDFAAEVSGIAELAGESRITAGIDVGEDVSLLNGALVSSGYFSMLRPTPALGHFPGPRPPHEPTIVLSDALWRRAFGSDPSIVGRQIRVNGHFFRVAAVAPPEFAGTNRELASEYWIDATFAPLLMPSGQNLLSQRGYRAFRLIGRLREDASLEALRARLALVALRLHREDPRTWADTTGGVRRVTVMLEREARMAGAPKGDVLLMTSGIIALGFALLALASVNLAGLQMARAAARRREIATRLALGAGRARLVRQLLTESAVIAVPGALLGLAFAWIVSVVVSRYRPAGLPVIDMAIDIRSLAFVGGGAVVALLVFGLMPALQSVRTDVLTDLKGIDLPGTRGIRVGGVRGALIVAQVALSVMFTAASGLIVLGIARNADDNRMDVDRVLVAPLTLLPAAGDSIRAAAVVDEIVSELGQLPGVEAVSAVRFVPHMGTRMTTGVGLPDASGQRMTRWIDVNIARPRYFRVVGVRMLRGRDFDDRDMTGVPRVAIASSALAQRLWPGGDPIGKRMSVVVTGSEVEVIGVVGDLRAPSARSPDLGLLYLPMTPGSAEEFVLHMRVNGPATALSAPVAQRLRGHKTHVAASSGVTTLARYLEIVMMPQLMTARASAALGVLQWLLAIAGLSGLVAYVTAQRRREIGIRTALGARGRSIIALVLRQSVRLTAAGAAIGIVLSLIVGRVIATVVPVSAGIEVRALAVAVVSFAIVAAVAMLLPASRALAVAPATALRVD